MFICGNGRVRRVRPLFPEHSVVANHLAYFLCARLQTIF